MTFTFHEIVGTYKVPQQVTPKFLHSKINFKLFLSHNSMRSLKMGYQCASGICWFFTQLAKPLLAETTAVIIINYEKYE
jgi:hypothetical protein